MARTKKDDRARYQEYLCSREWAEKREAVRERSGGRCERCHVLPMEACHHLTYARKYNESLDDLQAICTPCHEFTHGKSDFDPKQCDDWMKFIIGLPSNASIVDSISYVMLLMREFPHSLFAYYEDEYTDAMRTAWQEFSRQSALQSSVRWVAYNHMPEEKRGDVQRLACEEFGNCDLVMGVFTLKTLYYEWYDRQCPKPPASHTTDSWLRYWGWSIKEWAP